MIKEASVDMHSFSKRMGLRELDIPKNDYVSKSLLNRLINYIDRKEFSNFLMSSAFAHIIFFTFVSLICLALFVIYSALFKKYKFLNYLV